jgi:phosphoribosylaminoimidazole carboxylase (NCAIR synthetase)
MTAAAIVPPATLGILGGGQLGRYAVMAAASMGYRTMVLDPDPSARPVCWPTNTSSPHTTIRTRCVASHSSATP